MGYRNIFLSLHLCAYEEQLPMATYSVGPVTRGKTVPSVYHFQPETLMMPICKRLNQRSLEHFNDQSCMSVICLMRQVCRRWRHLSMKSAGADFPNVTIFKEKYGNPCIPHFPDIFVVHLDVTESMVLVCKHNIYHNATP